MRKLVLKDSDTIKIQGFLCGSQRDFRLFKYILYTLYHKWVFFKNNYLFSNNKQ